ncbi:hypothetical protein NLG97_g2545 [Lecanicillium saksenae]|uniref:Uncharacterized protein n=1 Tax=Lecanicillium saksenae TaxID=468837 RepID=A0ACC1R0L4_9HYPO|nr:hypothetical protein NLG97_g2545 [Lecanicillium saksenae]
MASSAETTGPRELGNGDYTVGWICALPEEYVAARAFLDEQHKPAENTQHEYTLGRLGGHNIVIGVLPDGEYGTASASSIASNMLHAFPNITIGLMVGIAGGAPAPARKRDIRLGDVVVSVPRGGSSGVFQYDFGKTIQEQAFQGTRVLNQPPAILREAVSGIRADHEMSGHGIQEAIATALQKADVVHPVQDGAACESACSSDSANLVSRPERDEDEENPVIHYGVIATANQLMKDAYIRDKLAHEKDVLCFEMEAGGLMNHFPCLVIRGICDYSDSHKNKKWQGYAAMTAAAYAKELLQRISPGKVASEKKLREIVDGIQSVSLNTLKIVECLREDDYTGKIRKWLSPPDPSTNFNLAKKLHQPGTGKWFLESDAYGLWKIKRSSFLWCYGIPGCGKTILSSTVIQNLTQHDETSVNSLYFFFDFTDETKRSAENALRSLMIRLYRQQKCAQDPLDALYTSCSSGSQQPSVALLKKTFRLMVQKCESLWIVLDALDECLNRHDRHDDGLMPWVRDLHEMENIHLLVTSRPEQDIQSMIKTWATPKEIIPLESELVAADIAAYVETQVQRMRRWQSDPTIREAIKSTLIKKAKGMFRWVAC